MFACYIWPASSLPALLWFIFHQMIASSYNIFTFHTQLISNCPPYICKQTKQGDMDGGQHTYKWPQWERRRCGKWGWGKMSVANLPAWCFVLSLSQAAQPHELWHFRSHVNLNLQQCPNKIESITKSGSITSQLQYRTVEQLLHPYTEKCGSMNLENLPLEPTCVQKKAVW